MVVLFVVLELFTNLVLETVLYAGAAGVSQVALLVSVAFWTWLWGPLGLLMATPLTVCLVVLGKHVPGLEFVGTLMADTPALAAEYGYYQRLLARDQSEAADLIERHIKTDTPRSVYDALLLPALNYAERDRLEQRLSPDEETAVIDATRELLSDAAESIRRLTPEPAAPPDGSPLPGPREPLRVLGYATNGVADELALAHARPYGGRSANRRRDHRRAAGLGIGVARARARVLGRVLRRSATQPVVEDALSRQEAPRRVTRRADPGRALGTAGAGGREHPGAAGGRGESRGLDAPGHPRRIWAGWWKSRGFPFRRQPACTLRSSRVSHSGTSLRPGRRASWPLTCFASLQEGRELSIVGKVVGEPPRHVGRAFT